LHARLKSVEPWRNIDCLSDFFVSRGLFKAEDDFQRERVSLIIVNEVKAELERIVPNMLFAGMRSIESDQISINCDNFVQEPSSIWSLRGQAVLH